MSNAQRGACIGPEEARVHLLEMDPRFDQEDAHPRPDEECERGTTAGWENYSSSMFHVSRFKWTDDCEAAFQELKVMLAAPPILTQPKIKKATLAIITIARKFRPYFQSHLVVCRANLPIRQIMRKPDLAGRMIGWAVELSKFDVTYERRGHIKVQVLADFINELTPNFDDEELSGNKRE
ncbi:hypothetical protein CR513_35275, partial [Mucuna pruriens]